MGRDGKQCTVICAGLLLGLLPFAARLRAQSPEGPIPPRPGGEIQKPPARKEATIKVRVALVNTPVTVRNPKGEMVHDLDRGDFRVYDNGVAQLITHLDLGGDPISMVILIENSSRIKPILPEIHKTGILFTQAVLGPTGEAAVLAFNDSIDKLLDFSADSDKIEKTISQIKLGLSGARLYDAMDAGIEMLTSRPDAGHRRVLFVVAEAVDTGSDRKLGELLRKAQLANVAVYSVGLSTTRTMLDKEPKSSVPSMTPPGTFGRPPIPGTVQTPTTEQQRDASADLLNAVLWAVTHITATVKDHPLEVAAVGTGGTSLSTFKDRSIEKAIDEIGGELHSQYTLSYTPAGSSEYGYHEIKVEVDRRDLKVRARPGYYLAAPES